MTHESLRGDGRARCQSVVHALAGIATRSGIGAGLAVGLASSSSAAGPPPCEPLEVGAIDRAAAIVDDEYGTSVAIDGDWAAVGSTGDDDAGNNAGSVTLHRRQGDGTWVEVLTLVPDPGYPGGFFGAAVALEGDLLVIGSPNSDLAANNAGAVHVHGRDVGGPDAWGEITIVTPSDAADFQFFGSAVDLDGETLVVGSPNRGDEGEGAVYVHGRDEGGPDAWGELAILTATGAGFGDELGRSVAIDGDTLVGGAPGRDFLRGAAFVFQRPAGDPDGWMQLVELPAEPLASMDGYGTSVAIGGDRLAVGVPGEDDGGFDAGAAFVHGREVDGADQWGLVTVVTGSDGATQDFFGTAVALEGDVLVVGAVGTDEGCMDMPPNCNSGSAELFLRDVGGPDAWGLVSVIETAEAQMDDQFGASLDLDGDRLVVGAIQQTFFGAAGPGRAFVFELGCSSPCPGDLVEDGQVDTQDLLELLAAWGTDGSGADLAEPTDLVDTADLLVLLAAWGPCD